MHPYDTSKRGGNAPRGLRIKRARDDFVSRLFNPSQASLLLRDEDDRSPNLPSATLEECNDNNCNYLSSNHHNFLNRLKNLGSTLIYLCGNSYVQLRGLTPLHLRGNS